MVLIDSSPLVTIEGFEPHLGIYLFIIYKVVKYRKILLIYNVYFIFSLVKI